MNPIETLSNEHGLIRHFLDNLSLATEMIENGKHPSEAFFEKAFTFAKVFTDEFHHFKEEIVLFTQMAQKKRGEVDAQLEALRHEHERGRNLVASMRKALPGYASKDSIKTGEMLEYLGAYTALLKHHIHIEDHVFYPMAVKTLTDNEFEIIAGEFAKQQEKHGSDTFEKCHKMVIDMGSILTHVQ